MTNNKIGVQRENKSCQTNLTLRFSKISHLFDKVTSAGLQNSGKIRTSSGTNLCWRKCTYSPPNPQATACLSEREWHRLGFKCTVELCCKFSQTLKTSMAVSATLHGMDVMCFHKVVGLRVSWSMEMGFAAKVQMDTSYGNSRRTKKGGGKYVENCKLTVFYRKGLVDKKWTVWKFYTLTNLYQSAS